MKQETRIICLSLPFRMGWVNCYLTETGAGYVLIDTGGSNSRKELVRALESAGCKPGFLRLVVITHGDFDHAGNAAYLRDTYGGKIAMHNGDSGMVEHGNMFVNRKKPNIFIRLLLPIVMGFGKNERFVPDILVKDGDDLSGYGMDARIVSIPGHSKGSIGVLAAGAKFFCGDLFENTDKPALNSLTDDFAAANASLEKLRGLRIETVYPGHGEPFLMPLINER